MSDLASVNEMILVFAKAIGLFGGGIVASYFAVNKIVDAAVTKRTTPLEARIKALEKNLYEHDEKMRHARFHHGRARSMAAARNEHEDICRELDELEPYLQ